MRPVARSRRRPGRAGAYPGPLSDVGVPAGAGHHLEFDDAPQSSARTNLVAICQAAISAPVGVWAKQRSTSACLRCGPCSGEVGCATPWNSVHVTPAAAARAALGRGPWGWPGTRPGLGQAVRTAGRPPRRAPPAAGRPAAAGGPVGRAGAGGSDRPGRVAAGQHEHDHGPGRRQGHEHDGRPRAPRRARTPGWRDRTPRGVGWSASGSRAPTRLEADPRSTQAAITHASPTACRPPSPRWCTRAIPAATPITPATHTPVTIHAAQPSAVSSFSDPVAVSPCPGPAPSSRRRRAETDQTVDASQRSSGVIRPVEENDQALPYVFRTGAPKRSTGSVICARAADQVKPYSTGALRGR